ncbi:MAG: DinB family protein [Cyclobacteriaceae bacterium]|nr:DinB family protein [Cyclobacteriaceae bacterium]
MKREISQEVYLHQLEEQLESQVSEVISVFQNLPEDQLLRAADNGGWCVAECLQHLNTYAEYYLPKIKNALSKAPDFKEAMIFKHSLLGQYFIHAMDASRSKKKYKAMKRHRPVNIQDPYEVVSRFILHLEEMQRLITQSGSKRLTKISVPTSISPWITINLGDAFQFLLTHNQRHLEQARRNLTSMENSTFQTAHDPLKKNQGLFIDKVNLQVGTAVNGHAGESARSN